MTEGELVEVRVSQVPVELWKRGSAHQDAIRREFEIIAADLPSGSVPHRLTALIAEFEERFGGYSDPISEDMRSAVERGDDEVTLVFEVPRQASAAASRLEDMLEEVDAFCRSGEDLLSLATPPELAAFRRWFLGEFVRQIDRGLPPMTWAEWQEEGAEAPTELVPASPGRPRKGGEPHPVRFQGDLDLATAGALRDEIMEARESGSGEVTVDLSEVGFMDSVGLSLLVTAYKRLAEDGASMRLILPEKLRRLFEISGLTDVLSPEFVGQGPSGAAGTSDGS